jgi:D-alanyl-D-alanine carboxypeptidase
MHKKLIPGILILAYLLTTLGCTIISNASSLGPELPFGQELQEALDAGLEQHNGFGMSAAVIVPGYTSWSGVSGLSHVATPITPETVFHAGSIGKNFIAALVLQLVDEGALTLDAAISMWLSDYPYVDNTITIRQLLNHTSGIFQINNHPDFFNSLLGDSTRFRTPEETLNTFLLDPYFPKGSGFHYSNANYILLGLIVEEITGTDVSTELRNRFIDPLDLNRTFFVVDEEVTEPVAHGWMNFSNYAPDIDVNDGYDEYIFSSQIALQSTVWTAGGIVSTPADLATWANALFHDKTVLSQKSHDEMLTFRPVSDSPIVNAYGLGAYQVNPDSFDGLEMYGHGGNIWAYKASCLYLPDYGVSISLMYNWDDDEAMFTLVKLLNIITTHLEPIF